MSMPLDTPADVMILPRSTTRAGAVVRTELLEDAGGPSAWSRRCRRGCRRRRGRRRPCTRWSSTWSSGAPRGASRRARAGTRCRPARPAPRRRPVPGPRRTTSWPPGPDRPVSEGSGRRHTARLARLEETAREGRSGARPPPPADFGRPGVRRSRPVLRPSETGPRAPVRPAATAGAGWAATPPLAATWIAVRRGEEPAAAEKGAGAPGSAAAPEWELRGSGRRERSPEERKKAREGSPLPPSEAKMQPPTPAAAAVARPSASQPTRRAAAAMSPAPKNPAPTSKRRKWGFPALPPLPAASTRAWGQRPLRRRRRAVRTAG